MSNYESSPSPSEFGFSIFSRRTLLAGAAGIAGAAALAACGSDDDEGGSSATTAAGGDTATTAGGDTGTTAAPSGDAVTYGSNYSDPKDSEAIAAAMKASQRRYLGRSGEAIAGARPASGNASPR